MEKIGKYELLEQLGRGGVGAVYRGRDTLLDREVAIKILHDMHGGDPELRERFYREARACARLNHPNIVAIYDFLEFEDSPSMVMELLRGQTLRALCRGNSAPPYEQRLELMAQVCEALGHAHASGIVHRDLKPSNIFIEDRGCAKVLDFGIARFAVSDLTRPGQALGTPDYMAPEQILGRTCDGRSDLFSAAIVLFEFLTGLHPFQARAITRRIVQGEPEPISVHAPQLPVSLEIALRKALEKDPDRRFRTGQEMAAVLRVAAEEVRWKSAGGAVHSRSWEQAPPLAESARYRQAPTPPPVETGNPFREMRVEAAPPIATPPPPTPPLAHPHTPVAPVLESPGAGTASDVAPEPPSPPPSDDAAPERIHLARESSPPILSGETGARPGDAERKPSPPRRRGKRLMAAAAAICLAIAVSAYKGADLVEMWNEWRGTGTGEAVAASGFPAPVGAASVASEQAPIYSAPDADSKRLITLRRADSVEILRAPHTRSQQWVAVRAASDRAVSGYMESDRLASWSSRDPEAAIAFLTVFGPAADAGRGQIESQIGEVERYLEWAGRSRYASVAHLELGSLFTVLARIERQSGDPSWPSRADEARGNLIAAGAEPALASQIELVRRAVDDLRFVEPPTAKVK